MHFSISSGYRRLVIQSLCKNECNIGKILSAKIGFKVNSGALSNGHKLTPSNNSFHLFCIFYFESFSKTLAPTKYLQSLFCFQILKISYLRFHFEPLRNNDYYLINPPSLASKMSMRYILVYFVYKNVSMIKIKTGICSIKEV
jgi:hypothetical protein